MASVTTSVETTSPDTQTRILDAALLLFAERGFHGTAVPLVAKAANVGAGTIYRYFQSKEALVNALYQREKHQVLGAVMADFPGHLPPREQFHHFFHRITAYARDHRASFQFLEHHHHAPYLDETSRQIEVQAYALVDAFLAETTRLRVTKPVVPHVLMSFVWGGIVHLMKEVWDGRVELTDEVIAQAETVCWEAVRL